MSGIARDHVPFFHHFGVRSFSSGAVVDRCADQFAPRLLPIGFGKFLGIALVDHRNLARAFLYLVGRRCAEAIAVDRNFSGPGCEYSFINNNTK